MRGLRVALVEKGDFAGATSSSSSKLIHGGLRYLPQGQLRLVYHALRERERLLRVTAPHLVHPLRFLYATYRNRGVGRFALSAGLFLYDLFANTPAAERHRRLSAAAVREQEPALSSDGLSGGALYYDAWADDARLTLENVLDASFHGAAIANYVAAEGFVRTGSQISALVATDLEGGASFELRARIFVNAAGPWVDKVRRMDDAACAPSVRLTKGVHLVIAGAHLPLRNSLVLSDEAGRIVFAMPRDGYVLVGTTDTDFTGDASRVAADEADIAYLLQVLTNSLHDLHLTPADVAYCFAGLRALVVGEGAADRAGGPSAVSREEVIIESRSGLLTVAGGKLTTHRQIAQQVVNRVMHFMRRRPTRSPTLSTPLIGARNRNDNSAASPLLPRIGAMLEGRYGSRAAMVSEIVRDRPKLAAELAHGAPAIAAEVVHAVRNEMARTLADFLVRRTSMVWRAPLAAIEAAPLVARLMAAELGWDRDRERSELAAFAASPGFSCRIIATRGDED
jgi:glycerol-3-phosphate dehydrogenase